MFKPLGLSLLWFESVRQSLYVGNLIPNLIVLGGGTLKREVTRSCMLSPHEWISVSESGSIITGMGLL